MFYKYPRYIPPQNEYVCPSKSVCNTRMFAEGISQLPPTLQTTQVPTNERRDVCGVVCSHSGVKPRNKKNDLVVYVTAWTRISITVWNKMRQTQQYTLYDSI